MARPDALHWTVDTVAILLAKALYLVRIDTHRLPDL